MNDLIIVRVNNYPDRFIKKCYENNISLHQVEYLDDESLLIRINSSDYKRIKKINYYSDIKIIKHEGIKGVNKHIKNNLYTYIFIFLCLILIDVISSYIVRIDIIHENSNIRNLVKEELENNDIKIFSLAKNFDELEEVKKNILENNPTKLEWLSITRVGMTYIVRIEERIITDITKEDGFAHIISTKNALITKISSNQGDVLVRSGEYVNKGDILISGEIKLYDSVKGNTLAKGDVYGDVWYLSDISFPIEYEEETLTGKDRINISINNKIIRRNKYKNFRQKKIKRLKVLGFNISIYTEVEITLDKKKYSLKEAEKLALEKVSKEMLIKLNNKGRIIHQNVLRKEVIYSTMNMSVFIVTNELISTTKHYTPIDESDDI